MKSRSGTFEDPAAPSTPDMDSSPSEQAAALRAERTRWEGLFANAPIPLWEEDFSAVRARFDQLRAQGVDDLERYLADHPDEIRHMARLVRIVHMSHATLRVFELDRIEDMPATLPSFFDAESLQVFARELLALWRGVTRYQAEMPVRAPSGRMLMLELHLAVFPGFEESLERVLVSFVDITERRAAEERHQASEERLRLATSAAKLGVFEWYVGTDHAHWENPRIYEIFGRSPDLPGISNAEFMASVLHPDDLESFQRDMAAAMQPGAGLHSICRIRRQDTGAVSWIEMAGELAFNPDGTPARVVGVVKDITERKQAEERIRRSEERAVARAIELQTVLDAVPAGVYITHDPTGAVIEANRYGHELLGVPEDENVARGATNRFRVERDGREMPAAELPVQLAAATGREVRDAELDIIRADGALVRLYGRAAPLRFGDAVRGAVGAFIDITELKRAQRALEDADRRKDEFLAVLSHELRNPLAAIRTAVDVLRVGVASGAMVRRANEAIERQVAHMARLLEDLLDVSRVTRQRLTLRTEPVAIADIVQGALETVRPLLETAGVAVSTSLPAERLMINGDPVRLTQVLSNILGNAAKYTDPGGSVAIAVSRADGQVCISVTDTGIGIAPEMLPHVFDMFVQAAPGSRPSQGGLGIGLALARGIVELHGGSIEARSAGPGMGSEFVVCLRLVSHDDSATPAGQGGDPTLVKSRILLADDNVDAAVMLGELLRVLGQEVHVAHDGKEAMRLAEACRPAIMLLDIGMPGADGYQVARWVRAQPWGKEPYLVAVTGWGKAEDIEHATQAGFDRHITKPVSMDILRQLLSRQPDRESDRQPDR